MNKNVSFNDIIIKNLKGCWCDGLALLNVYDESIQISNIYNNNGKNLFIDNYPICRDEEIFSKVIEMSYAEAIKEFNENKKSIVSPKVTLDLYTFDGIKGIEHGGNVYCNTEENKVIVNDYHRYENLEEIISLGLISDNEKKGIWLVF